MMMTAYLEWICFKFPSLKAAGGFVADVAEGYRLQGVQYVRAWERPKRRKGGYAVAIMTDKPARFDELAGYFKGVRMEPKDAVSRAELKKLSDLAEGSA